MNIRH